MADDNDDSLVGSFKELLTGGVVVMLLYMGFNFMNSSTARLVGNAIEGGAHTATWFLSSPYTFILGLVLLGIGYVVYQDPKGALRVLNDRLNNPKTSPREKLELEGQRATMEQLTTDPDKREIADAIRKEAPTYDEALTGLNTDAAKKLSDAFLESNVEPTSATMDTLNELAKNATTNGLPQNIIDLDENGRKALLELSSYTYQINLNNALDTFPDGKIINSQDVNSADFKLLLRAGKAGNEKATERLKTLKGPDKELLFKGDDFTTQSNISMLEGKIRDKFTPEKPVDVRGLDKAKTNRSYYRDVNKHLKLRTERV